VNPFESWHEEQRSAFVYQALAKFEPDPVKAGLFGKLANESLTQAEYWLREIERAGRPSPKFVPDWRARLVVKLSAWFGVRPMRPILAAIKVRGLSVYNDDLAPHPRPTASSGVEHRHRGLGGGGNLRAAVFGVNDGLVSNACLILGLAGRDGGRQPGQFDDPARGRRRTRRRRLRDGGRRIRIGAYAARILRIPDRPRA
jgi:hypothetical protein